MPLEIFTLLGGTILGIFKRILEHKNQQQIMLLEKAGMSIDSARRFNPEGVRVTRRVIALTTIFSVILLPKLVFLLGDIGVMYLTQLEHSSIWPFRGAKEVLEAKVVIDAIVITPLDTHLVSAIAGFYFGSGSR
jgi:hypothetical protein